MKFKNRFHHLFATILFAIGLFALAKGVQAQGVLGGDWARYLGGLRTFQDPTKSGELLAIDFIHNAIRIVKFIAGVLALLFGILYALAFIAAGSQEETITQQKKNFIAMGIAFVLLMIADTVAGIFNPVTSTSETIIDFGAANDQLRQIVDYTKWLLGSVLVLLMTVSGLKLMTAQGEEEKITREKKNLVWSGVGIMVILLASNIVNAIYVIRGPDDFVPANPTTAVQEAAGVIRLLLVFLGPIAILFTIYAGFFYLTALDDEERVTKGKMMIVGGVTGIIVIYVAYAIINTLLTASFVPAVSLLSSFLI